MTEEQKARYKELKERINQGEHLSESDYAWMSSYRRHVAGALRSREHRAASKKYYVRRKGMPRVIGGYNTAPSTRI